MKGKPGREGSTKAAGQACFRVRCEADDENRFAANADSLTVTVGQWIVRRGGVELWDSVSIHAQRRGKGNLEVQVFLFHPDWDEPLEIASIRSRPQDRKA
jgi:hypothetical protein